MSYPASDVAMQAASIDKRVDAYNVLHTVSEPGFLQGEGRLRSRTSEVLQYVGITSSHV